MKKNLKYIWFIIPSMIGMAVFYVIPFGTVIKYSFINNITSREFAGFDNYINLFKNEAFVIAVKNSLVFCAAAVPASVFFSLWLACLLTRKIRAKSFVRSCLISPLMVPTASIVLVWQILFSLHGTVNDWLSFFGMEACDWLRSDYAMWPVVLMYLWKNTGYVMILYMAALASVPSELVDAARVDGAGSLVVFWKIKIRFILPTMVFVTILDIVSSFKIFREIYYLSGGYPTQSLYMLQHFINNTFSSLNYQKMSAAAVLMAAVLCVVLGGLFMLERHFGRELEDAG